MLDLESDQIEKYFKEGQRVEVLSGNNQGTSGIVTKIEDGKVRILREDNKAELLVMLSNLALKTADYSK